MKIKRLKYYAKKPNYPETPFKVKNGIEPPDREFLSFIYEHHPIFINGAKFFPNHIFAKPRKKTVVFEIWCFVLLILGLLHWNIPAKDISWIHIVLSCVFGAIFGILLGMLRIEMQKDLAKKFNDSRS